MHVTILGSVYVAVATCTELEPVAVGIVTLHVVGPVAPISTMYTVVTFSQHSNILVQ